MQLKSIDYGIKVLFMVLQLVEQTQMPNILEKIKEIRPVLKLEYYVAIKIYAFWRLLMTWSKLLINIILIKC